MATSNRARDNLTYFRSYTELNTKQIEENDQADLDKSRSGKQKNQTNISGEPTTENSSF
jgi:hypothetical protein